MFFVQQSRNIVTFALPLSPPILQHTGAKLAVSSHSAHMLDIERAISYMERAAIISTF